MIGETKMISEVDELRVEFGDAEMYPVKIISDYRANGGSGVIDLGTFGPEEMAAYTNAGNAFYNDRMDGWNNRETKPFGFFDMGACTACMKKMPDGSVLMGRNMDVPSSFYPAYIFRGKGNGKDTYDTVNIGYCVPGTVTFDQIAETSSVPKSLLGAYVCNVFDVLNSAGLFLEENGRYPRGEAASCSTNPKGEIRTSDISLARYIGDHCATVEEAIEYVKTLDIYTAYVMDAPGTGFAVGMMDRTGRYGVLEVAFNKTVWNEGRPGFACGQTNFFWDKRTFEYNDMNVGLGRWDEVIKRYNYIHSEEDMQKVMERVWYDDMITNGTLAKDWKTDFATDFCEFGESLIRNKWIASVLEWRDRYGISVDEEELQRALAIADKQTRENIQWDDKYVQSPEGRYEVYTVQDLYVRSFAQLPVEAKKFSGLMEITSIGYVCSNKRLEYTLRFFEMNDIYHITPYETRIDRIPTDRELGKV